MSLSLSPSKFRQMLLQSLIGKDLRRSLAHAFAFGEEGWRQLALVGEKRPCLPTRDPSLLALRRLAWPELGELHAMHRLAVLEAAHRPHGFLHLLLEEAAALEHPEGLPEVQADTALKVFFSLAPENGKPPHQEELKALRSRGVLYSVRRLLALGDPLYKLFLPFAYFRVGEEPRDPELQLFLHETIAMVLEHEGKPKEGVTLLLPAVLELAENEDLAAKLADRCAEGLALAADILCRHQLSPGDAEAYYGMARSLLQTVSPSFNLPLRRRLFALAQAE